MSYGIRIETKDGTSKIASTYGDIPDGVHEVNGHEGAGRNIQVVRHYPDGRVAFAAAAHHCPAGDDAASATPE